MSSAVVIAPGYACHQTEMAALAPFGVGVHVLEWANDRSRLLKGVAEAPILFVRDTAMDAGVIQACRQAKGIVRYGVGIDRIDLDQAREQGIKVVNIPDYGADIEVADHTLALYLAVQRRVVSGDTAVRQGVWGIAQASPIGRIGGQVLGLIGFGRIARAVRSRFAAFGVKDVIVHDPWLTPEAAKAAGVTQVSLGELARSAQIVSIHAPATDPDRPMIDRAFLAAMRPDAILLNTARGAHVDEVALTEILRAERIFGAGLDTLRQEPPTPDHPFLSLSNVVLSDHAGWYSEATVASLQGKAAAAAVTILSGQTPDNWVNP
ncbi:C-terminal binding protein [Aureimonas fodinaquatilis]|uniref:C-terminal binding protein n=1 Tax=Aureimonas fodinaquatilis TaxID=2565783 RepID=A0A5B0DWZ1_9HYPH|nr:C-terminal binding protein [Aureimonas fodinaquatilis]KAA0970983.1 C-terminal binding protein [Aureimonas fodinaquatilis]